MTALDSAITIRKNLTLQDLDTSIPEKLGVQIESERPLAGLTTMKVGGPAQFFATVNSVDHLLKIVRWARAQDLPYFVLGGGSNMLISDAGIRGLVIHNRCRSVRIDPAPCCVFPQDERPFVFAESGAALAGVARRAVQEGLTGLEWAVSVPGTVGGAVVGNAGAHGGEVKDNLWNALLLDEEGDLQDWGVDEFAYAYRSSKVKRMQPVQAGYKPVILTANFRIPYANPDEVRARADQFLAHRRNTQPVEPSLGSTFVNPPGEYAGRLIDAAGLKGFRIGGIEISPVHANFLVNPGGVGAGRAQDVLALIRHIQATVQAEFGIALIPEIMFVGEWNDPIS